MQWSQLKKQLKDRIAKSVAGRIDIHETRYRQAHDQEGEFWITVDRDRVFSAGSATYLSKLGKLVTENHDKGNTWAAAYEQAWPIMNASGLLLLEQLNIDLFGCLNQTVEQMLTHRNPVVRALAVLDARYGKRRLVAFNPLNEHPLVQQLFLLRCEAEGIKPSNFSVETGSQASGTN